MLSPACTSAAEPSTVTRCLWPRTLTRSTQNPLSALWNVTRSTSPAKDSRSRSASEVALTIELSWSTGLKSRCSALPGTRLPCASAARLFEQPVDRAARHAQLAGYGGGRQTLAGQLLDALPIEARLAALVDNPGASPWRCPRAGAPVG